MAGVHAYCSVCLELGGDREGLARIGAVIGE